MSTRFDELVRLMARLRAPDGCPWDRKQTHESLKPYLVEEAYEVLETIDRGHPEQLREELGDLLLQIVFHAQIGAEKGTFTIDEVMQRLAEKLVRRHPHVFGNQDENARPANAEEVLGRWEEIKRNERQQAGQHRSVLDSVPKTLPALLRAFQVQARASRIGFDWPHSAQGLEQVMAKVEEEVRELRDVLTHGMSDNLPRGPSPPTDSTGEETRARLEDEFGDILFALVNLARFFKVNPEEALRKAINRFTERFSYIETQAASRGQAVEDLTLAEMESFWEEAKGQRKAKPP